MLAGINCYHQSVQGWGRLRSLVQQQCYHCNRNTGLSTPTYPSTDIMTTDWKRHSRLSCRLHQAKNTFPAGRMLISTGAQTSFFFFQLVYFLYAENFPSARFPTFIHWDGQIQSEILNRKVVIYLPFVAPAVEPSTVSTRMKRHRPGTLFSHLSFDTVLLADALHDFVTEGVDGTRATRLVSTLPTHAVINCHSVTGPDPGRRIPSPTKFTRR